VAVAAILEDTLKQVKERNPAVQEAFLRSDNAGCYHCAPLLLAIPAISERSGVHISRYDYSEPQKGKDICDRKIAIMKTHIHHFVNEGNNVTTAKEMKEALESHNGVTGCFSAVVEVKSEKVTKNTWPGIQSLYNFSFNKDGIRAWKAYNIGSGKLYSKTPDKTSHFALEVVEGFETENLQERATGIPVKRKGKEQAQDEGHNEETTSSSKGFSCPEINCVKEFMTFRNLQKHLDVGRHDLRTHEKSMPDHVKLKWAEVCTSLTSKIVSAASGCTTSSDSDVDVSMGWALKASRKLVRFSEKVKAHLLNLFLEGENTGHKADPSDVAMHMRRGKEKFSKEEWLTAHQVKSYFSRLASLQRAGRLPKRVIAEDEDTSAEEAEGLRFQLRQKIRQEVDL